MKNLDKMLAKISDQIIQQHYFVFKIETINTFVYKLEIILAKYTKKLSINKENVNETIEIIQMFPKF